MKISKTLLSTLLISSASILVAQSSQPASQPSTAPASQPSSAPASQPAEKAELEIIESPIAENCYGQRPADAVIDTVVIHHASAIYWFNDDFQEIVGEDGKSYAEQIQLTTQNLDQHKYDWLLVKPIFEAYKVSSHYAIARNGDIVRFVADEDRAYHAGTSTMPVPGDDRTGLNDFTIGIELMSSHPDLDDEVKTPEDAYTKEQYKALEDLMKYLCENHPIKYVVGHDEIAPGRKTDPGPLFQWDKIRNENFTAKHCE